MNMDNGSTVSTSMGMTVMMPWLHFTGGDHLYFKSWQPTSAGAIAGACIGLFILALFDRWLAATRGVLESHWWQRSLALTSRSPPSSGKVLPTSSPEISTKNPEAKVDIQESSGEMPSITSRAFPKHLIITPRTIPPFIPAHDFPRGIIHAVQALLGYLLMLAVMTFNAAYIISIIIGLGIGEIVFGRSRSGRNSPQC